MAGNAYDASGAENSFMDEMGKHEPEQTLIRCTPQTVWGTMTDQDNKNGKWDPKHADMTNQTIRTTYIWPLQIRVEGTWWKKIIAHPNQDGLGGKNKIPRMLYGLFTRQYLENYFFRLDKNTKFFPNECAFSKDQNNQM